MATLLDRPIVLRALTLLVVGALWELGASMTDAMMIPGFVETVAEAVRLLATSEFWSAVAVSNQALVAGFALALVTGIPLGLAMGRFRRLEQLADVYINILIVTPMAAITPLLLMALGVGLASRIVLVYVFSVVMIVVQSRAGVRQVDTALLEMATSFGATERQLWTQILIPNAIPAIMTGVRIGLGRAITGMVIAELLLVTVGLGGLILEFRGFFLAPSMYATVGLVVLEALILVELARHLERRLTP